MKKLALTITEATEGRTVESLLSRELRVSDTLIRRLKRRERGILLDGEPAFTTARVRRGSLLEADVSDEPGKRPPALAAAFGVLYEDSDIIIMDKPAGMAAHSSTRDPLMPTAEGALSAYLPADVTAHPVSRLDRGTSGAMTFAKSGYIHELLRRQMEAGGFYKEYAAVCVGVPSPLSGRIDAPTGFDENSHYKRAVRAGGAASVTEYETLFEGGGLSLVRLVPRTGRMHQLRVHMAYIGAPLAGDWLYGTEDGALIARPALHARLVRFTHPETAETVEVRAPIPADMAALMARMGAPRLD